MVQPLRKLRPVIPLQILEHCLRLNITLHYTHSDYVYGKSHVDILIDILSRLTARSTNFLSSTYLCTGQLVDTSLINTKYNSGPSHEPWGIAPLSSFQEDINWLVRTLC